MRFWSRRAARDEARPRRPRPFETLDNLDHLVDEGHLVALAAVRLSTKNEIVLRTLRDGGSWNEEDGVAMAQRAVDALLVELGATAHRLAQETQRATPLPLPDPDAPGARRPGRAERARLARLRKHFERQREESERLSARTRTMRGVMDRLRTTRQDDETLREIALRARDDTLAELVQARLIPRRAIVRQTEEEQREAIAGVRADLARLLEEHEGY